RSWRWRTPSLWSAPHEIRDARYLICSGSLVAWWRAQRRLAHDGGQFARGRGRLGLDLVGRRRAPCCRVVDLAGLVVGLELHAELGREGGQLGRHLRERGAQDGLPL